MCTELCFTLIPLNMATPRGNPFLPAKLFLNLPWFYSAHCGPSALFFISYCFYSLFFFHHISCLFLKFWWDISTLICSSTISNIAPCLLHRLNLFLSPQWSYQRKTGMCLCVWVLAVSNLSVKLIRGFCSWSCRDRERIHHMCRARNCKVAE